MGTRQRRYPARNSPGRERHRLSTTPERKRHTVSNTQREERTRFALFDRAAVYRYFDKKLAEWLEAISPELWRKIQK